MPYSSRPVLSSLLISLANLTVRSQKYPRLIPQPPSPKVQMDENGRPTLPVEIICRIICLLSPRDVIRLRTVSKQFHDISYLPHIWRTLYVNARLPRPPGPFPSQSVQFLQRTLLKSDRLSLSWTNRPMRDISCLEIEPQGFPLHFPKVVDGRWLIDCESSGRTFVVHDLDSDSVSSTRQVLYQQDQTVHNWDASSLTSIDGPVVYIVFNVKTPRGSFSPWKLLEFRVSNTSGQLYYLRSLDIPMRKFVQIRLHGGHGPFLYLQWHHLILDGETREFYRFPALSSELGSFSTDCLVNVQTLISKTHVILCYPDVHGSTLAVRSMLVQVFMLPPDPSPVAGDLPLMRLSHEGIVNGHFQNISIIRNSVVDPIIGWTNIRLLDQSFVEGGGLHFKCIDLTLPKHTPAEMSMVLPMEIVAQDVLKVDRVLHGDWTHHVDASEDGYARGMWESCSMAEQPPSNCHVLRFEIDASEDKCTAVVGEQSHSQWSRIDHPRRTRHLGVDCAIGRWWYINEWAVANGEDARRRAFAFDIV